MNVGECFPSFQKMKGSAFTGGERSKNRNKIEIGVLGVLSSEISRIEDNEVRESISIAPGGGARASR